MASLFALLFVTWLVITKSLRRGFRGSAPSSGVALWLVIHFFPRQPPLSFVKTSWRHCRKWRRSGAEAHSENLSWATFSFLLLLLSVVLLLWVFPGTSEFVASEPTKEESRRNFRIFSRWADLSLIRRNSASDLCCNALAHDWRLYETPCKKISV